MRTYSDIDLAEQRNAAAATYDADMTRAAVNAWGNSLPAEELPFGETITVAGVPFRFPPANAAHDHVEPLGQTIDLAGPLRASGLAMLCFGEMGDQYLDVDLYSGERRVRRLTVLAKGWLGGAQTPAADCYRLSHLHYPSGYGLSLLRPALWCGRRSWRNPALLTRLVLGRNPLFHLFALTCWHEC